MTAEENFYMIDDNDTSEFNQALDSFISNKFISREKLNEKLDAWKKEKLNIGIIGETSSGKSNLINTFRGLFPTDKGASKIKVTQATNFPKPYDDPQYQNIKYWDTPGYNGIKSISSAPDYLEDIDTFIKNLSKIPAGKKKEFEQETGIKYEEIDQPIKYDCFIICFENTFHETDLNIVKQIRKANMNYFLVRTKMDLAVQSREGDLGRELTNQDENDLFTEIKENVNKSLVKELLPKDAEDDRYIFLVSAYLRQVERNKRNENGEERKVIEVIDNRNKFDFVRLQSAITQKLKGEKRSLFIYSLFNSSESNIKIKCDNLRKRIKWAALASGAAGAVAIPGVSGLVDVSILINRVLFYMKTLGIWETEFKKIANSFKVDYLELKRDVLDKNPIVKAIFSLSAKWGGIILLEDSIQIIITQGSKELVEILLEYLSKQAALNSAEEALKSVLAFFPGIGTAIASIIGAGISFGATYFSLKNLLDCFESVLLETIKYCKDKK